MKINISLLLLIALLALGCYALYTKVELYEKTSDNGADEEALKNPFLAAQRYLQAQQVDVQSGSSVDLLDTLPESGTAIVADSRDVLTAQRADELQRWVERGGHLIVGVNSIEDDGDPLLSRYAIKKYSTHFHRADSDRDDDTASSKKLSEVLREMNQKIKENANKKNTENTENTIPICADDDEITHLKKTGSEQTIAAHFNPYSALHQPHIDGKATKNTTAMQPNFWAGSTAGKHFVQFRPGRGSLTVLSDISIWDWQHIGTCDHAYLLGSLINPQQAVRIVYGAQMPGIATLLWRYGAELIIAAAIWLLAWLWYRARRFGPALASEQQTRRALDEHILAAARYQWQRNGADNLLQTARTALQHHANLRFADYENLSSSQKSDYLAAHTGIERQRIERALQQSPPRDADIFREIIATLQQIGKKL